MVLETTDLETKPSPTAAATVVAPAPLWKAMQRRGFDALTAVQEAALAAAGDGVDLQISSQTGSGKTVALGLVMANDLIQKTEHRDERPTGPDVLVIAPTRELAVQVADELGWLFGEVRAVTVDCVTGGTSVEGERRRLTRRPRIVVGTPGRLLDHIGSGALDGSTVQTLVLDEADQMLDMGFRDELEAILEALPAERRTHLVSATFPSAVKRLTEKYQRNAVHVEGTALGAAHEDIEHVAHMVHQRDRYGTLVNLLLLAEGRRTLVFVRTRAETTELAERLSKDGFSAMPLSGDLQQAQRTRTLTAFRNGVVKTLIATDVAARGLDVPNVGRVVQYSPPHDADGYTHRSGRTGRAGKKGQSVLLVGPAAHRRMRFMLRDIGAPVEWRDAPDAKTVTKRLAHQARTRLQEALETATEPTEKELATAKWMLGDRDPAAVIATMLRQLQPDLPRQPADIGKASAPPERKHDKRGRPAMRGPNDRYARFTRFSINWGMQGGANPKRLLAHVCRRGDISGRLVGDIQVGPTSATFEVAESVAHGFEARVRRPDPRDPGLQIRRMAGRGAGGSQERRGNGGWRGNDRAGRQ